MVLKKFTNVFLEEILGLPPRRDIKFTIELIPGIVPTMKAPYCMSTHEIVELKIYLKEMLHKGYIRPNISPKGAPSLFARKKDGTLRLCIDH